VNIYSFSSLVASIFCFTTGTLVLIKRSSDKKCKLFGIASLLTGLWTLFPFAMSKIHNINTAVFFARLIYVPAIFTAPAWLHFVFAVVKERWLREEKRILILSYCLAILFFSFNFSPFFIKGINRFAPHFSVVPGPFYIYFVGIFGLIFIYIIKTIFYGFQTASGYYRNQLKFILLSFVFGFASGILHFGAAYLKKEPIPHDFFLIIYTGLIAYAIFRHRLMDITLTITRTGVFIAVYTLVLGLPFVLTTFGRAGLIEILGTNWWVAPLVLMAALATAGPFVYIFLQKRAEAILLREQRRYQETLKQSASGMTRIRNLQKLLDLIMQVIIETVGISHVAVYLLDVESKQFVLKAGRNLKEGQMPSIDNKSALITWLQDYRQPLLYEEIKGKAQESPNPVFKKLVDEMQILNAAVVVPSLLEDKLLNLLILGEKKSGRIYTSEDLDVFSTLASQAALGIENALLYGNIEEQVKQRTKELVEVQRQLVQAEKLATVGTLAGGVAHEINNPLTAILTNVQMLLVSNKVTSDDRESLQLIEEATKRCRTIVKKLMTYARRPLETTATATIDLLDVVRSVISFLGYQLEQENIKIISEAKEGSYEIEGNRNELEQVLTNLVLNARDAIKRIKKDGAVHISLFRNNDWINIEIRDEGIGMPKDIIPKVFDPFFTTKEVGRGLGLGLSICQAIVERHNGIITVQSEPNRGSRFTIQLPKTEEKDVAKSKVKL
jgi:signal transduction histidine kinase